MNSCIKKLEEKGFLSAVSVAEWSEKMDLVAVGFVSGEYSLFRLSWQKVWHCNAPSNNSGAVSSMAWRVTDSRVIAVAFENISHIMIVDINTANCVHKLMLAEIPIRVSFGCLAHKLPASTRGMDSQYSVFLPPLPNLSKNLAPDAVIYHEGVVEKAKILQSTAKSDKENAQLDVLIVVQESFIYFYSCCLYPIFKINLGNVNKTLKVRLPEENFPLLSMSYLNNERNLVLDWYSLENLMNNWRDLNDQSEIVYNLISCFEYISTCVQAMLDSWQDALGEVQLKLARFSLEKSSPGTVGDEFLMLLLFGKPRSEFLLFLSNELTSKGCDNLRNSISSSYAVLSNLIVNHILPATRAMMFHAHTLYKMFRQESIIDTFKSRVVMKCLKTVGSLALKANEMLVVMEKTQIELQSFFKWLYYMLLKLSDETIPPDLSQSSQHELIEVANFIKENLNETVYIENTPEGKKKRAVFRLEKVGQYLSKEDLKEPCQFHSKSPLAKFWLELFENSGFDENDVVFDPCFKSPLRQVLADLEKAISVDLANVLSAPDAAKKVDSTIIAKSLKINETFSCLVDISMSDKKLYFSYSDKSSIYLLKCNVDSYPNVMKTFSSIKFKTDKFDYCDVKAVRFMGSKLCMLLQEMKDWCSYRLILVDIGSHFSELEGSQSWYEDENEDKRGREKVENIDEHHLRFPEFGVYQDIVHFKTENRTESKPSINGNLILSPNVEYDQLSVSAERKLACVSHQHNKRILFIDLDSPLDDDEDDDENEIDDHQNDSKHQDDQNVSNDAENFDDSPEQFRSESMNPVQYNENYVSGLLDLNFDVRGEATASEPLSGHVLQNREETFPFPNENPNLSDFRTTDDNDSLTLADLISITDVFHSFTAQPAGPSLDVLEGLESDIHEHSNDHSR